MASPRGPLSKLRRNKGPAASATSLTSSTSDGDDVPSTGDKLLSTVDRTIGKVKDRTRKSTDGRRGSVDERPSRLSTMLPGRRDRRGSTHKDANDSSRLERQLSVDSNLLGNRSDTSLGLNGGSSRSSLLTDDCSEGEKKPTRPTISPHDSHAGLLTLSSPLIHAQTSPIISVADDNTLEPHQAAAQSVPNIPHIVEPSQTSDEALTTTTEPRPASAQKKLKGAFALVRKKSDDGASTAQSGGGGLGGLFKSSSRRGSVNPADAPTVALEVAQAETAVAEALGADSPQVQEVRPETPTDSKKRLRIGSGSLPGTPNNLTDTPTTVVTPPTPTDSNANRSTFNSPTKASPAQRSLSSVDSIRNRRAQSSLAPSKLSNSIAPPLTPTAEEFKTPGGTLTSPGNTGFFSNFFTAAQKAANQLTDTINIGNGPGQKSRLSIAPINEERGGEEVIPGVTSISEPEGERRELAVETLGEGSLSLSQFGITDGAESTRMNSTINLSQQNGTAVLEEAGKKAEEDAAARAVSAAYEQPVEKVVKQATGGSRPMSVASTERLGLNGDATPPRTVDMDSAGGLRRQGSVRSKLSGRRKRHRGSSATTAGTNGANSLAAGLSSTLTGLANPGAAGPGHRLTGFAVASSKRNKDFHQLFRSVPEDDYLIEDYSAALQRDILLHGRLYVSEGHICFSSNILGWVTNLVISFDEVVSVEKKSTAVIFPNALIISTLHARNTFASFVARDSTYELLIGIWKINHPNLKSSLNGVTLDNAGTGDKTEKADSLISENGSDSASDEVYDEDEDEDDMGSLTEADGGISIAGSDIGDGALSRKTSAVQVSSNTAPGQPSVAIIKGLEGADSVVTAAAMGADYPGPQMHAPTECSDSAEHYDRPLTDTTIPAPLGKVYSMMWGPASGAFMKKWLVEDQKSRELEYSDDKTGLDNDHKQFTFTYIKPLNAPVGPRQTKCITTNTLEGFDLEKAVTVSCSTQTPDVPSGNVFTTKTRYCLMWGPGNSTRMVANCTIEWTGKSWLKGPIEKGAQDGQTAYVKDILAALKAAVTTKPPVKGVARKGKRKGKKEVFDAEEAQKERSASVAASLHPTNWGLLEPIRPLLEPFLDILKPILPSSQVFITILLVLVLWQWLRAPRYGDAGSGLTLSKGQRLAAYDDLWRREESELWEWLEDRVGFDEIYAPGVGGGSERQKVLAARDMGKKLEGAKGRMGERQVDEAIKATEEKLQVLKDAVAKGKLKKGRKG